jgi:hypothetical protein
VRTKGSDPRCQNHVSSFREILENTKLRRIEKRRCDRS